MIEDSFVTSRDSRTPDFVAADVAVLKNLNLVDTTLSTVFEAASKEIDQTKRVEQQRRADMSLYAIVIFISFFVFIAVILIINSTIIAAFLDVQSKMPSTKTISPSNLQIAHIDPLAIKNAFFAFVIVQSIGGGLLGGFMMDGKISSGIRFGFVLVLVSFFVFKFMF